VLGVQRPRYARQRLDDRTRRLLPSTRSVGRRRRRLRMHGMFPGAADRRGSSRALRERRPSPLARTRRAPWSTEALYSAGEPPKVWTSAPRRGLMGAIVPRRLSASRGLVARRRFRSAMAGRARCYRKAAWSAGVITATAPWATERRRVPTIAATPAAPRARRHPSRSSNRSSQRGAHFGLLSICRTNGSACQWPPETDPSWPSEIDPPPGGRDGDLHGESVAGSSSGSLRLRAWPTRSPGPRVTRTSACCARRSSRAGVVAWPGHDEGEVGKEG
jgi:hypothetical protein